MVHVILFGLHDVKPRIWYGVVIYRIKLSYLIHVHDSGVVENRVEVKLIQFYIRGVPVHWIALEHELVVRFPQLDLEWTTTDDVFRKGPLATELLYSFARHDPENLVCQQTKEEWRRLDERNPDSVFVGRFDADVLGLNLHELFAIDRCF